MAFCDEPSSQSLNRLAVAKRCGRAHRDRTVSRKNQPRELDSPIMLALPSLRGVAPLTSLRGVAPPSMSLLTPPVCHTVSEIATTAAISGDSCCRCACSKSLMFVYASKIMDKKIFIITISIVYWIKTPNYKIQSSRTRYRF